MKVWDATVRLLHWSLVACVVLGWASGYGLVARHEAIGYAALAIVGLRIVWGFAGGPYARFSQFVRGPRATWRYAVALHAGHAPRHLGHNPLGAWMIVALLGCVAGLGLTGFLFTTDMFWGYAWLEALHRALAWLLGGLVALHVSAAVLMGRHHRENLVRAMVSGLKKTSGG